MSNHALALFVCGTSLTALPAGSSPAASEQSVPQNHVCEFSFRGEGEAAASGALRFDVLFTGPEGDAMRVPGFWAGGRTYRVRFASPQTGVYRFRTECSDPSETGLHGQTGAVTVTKYSGDNPLYRHGPLRVTANRRFLEHADGTPFFWLGDTWWMGLTQRLDWPDGFQTLAADRKAKGFTVIQIVGGLPPDMPPLDPRGAGDGGQAWTEDFEQIRPEFYNEADRRIAHLVDQGLVPCVVGAWKHYLPVLGPEKMQRHWRNLIARYAAYPVVWVVGGEVNRTAANPRFLGRFEPAMETTESAFERGWSDVARAIHRTDPFGRIVGAHNQQNPHVLDDPALLDMYFLQTGHSALCSISAQADWFAELSRGDHRAPLILSEANYQGLFHEGSYGDQLQRHQFWATLLLGGAGHTYGANGIWQVNQPDQPFGPSPHGFVWGNTPWPEAMKHAASEQLGWSKSYVTNLPWQQWVPAKDQVRFAGPALPPIEQSDARWIWIPDGGRGDHVIGTTFEIPDGATVGRATLRVACETAYTLALNGQMIHRSFNLDYSHRLKHRDAWTFPLAGEYLQPGRNVLLLDFDKEDLPKADGLLADLTIELCNGEMIDVVSDSAWRWERPETGWPGYLLQLDPAEFESAVQVVGNLAEDADLPEFLTIPTYGPLCATIPGQQWVVYSPAAVPVELSGLPADSELTLERFNPRTGPRTALEQIRSDSFGRWQWEPPNDPGDWVLRIRKPPRLSAGS